MAHSYPGNIRELENIIEHAFILCTQGPIGLHHLPSHLSAPASCAQTLVNRPTSMSQIHQTTEREVILAALERNNYNRLATAKELGMHKSTLFRKLKKLQLDLPDIDGRTLGSRHPTVA
jgi:transcriptional regulator with PAS, ATPase and Fis domain